MVLCKTEYRCADASMKNKATAKYMLNSMGKTTSWITSWNNKANGKNVYEYSDNFLVSSKNYRSFTYKNNPKEPEWDSNLLSNEYKFRYKDGRLSSYSLYTHDLPSVFMEFDVQYNSDGKVSVENTKTYYDSFTVKLQQVHYAVSDRAEYSYNDTVTKIKYFRNNVFQSSEEIITNKQSKVLRQVLTGNDGTLRHNYTYRYDEKMQPVELKRMETGVDGFGNGSDIVAYEKMTFKYDEEGKLIQKECYSYGRVCMVEKFEYVK